MGHQLPSVDQLIELGKADPEALERLRTEHIEQLITAAPEVMQRRLRGLQFQIDSRRRLHSSPMGSCLMLSKMMLDSLSKLNTALHGTLDSEKTVTPETSNASIIPFPATASN